MHSIAITSRGQVTLRRDLLGHLGVRPGQRIAFEKLPGGEIRLRAEQPASGIESVFSLLAAKTIKVASIDEINQAAAAGWASSP